MNSFWRGLAIASLFVLSFETYRFIKLETRYHNLKRQFIIAKELCPILKEVEMSRVVIHEPIWNGGERCVGIAEFRMKDVEMDISIDYRGKDGSLIYPERYWIARKDAMKYPSKVVKGGVKLRIIPIKDLNVREGF